MGCLDPHIQLVGSVDFLGLFFLENSQLVIERRMLYFIDS